MVHYSNELRGVSYARAPLRAPSYENHSLGWTREKISYTVLEKSHILGEELGPWKGGRKSQLSWERSCMVHSLPWEGPTKCSHTSSTPWGCSGSERPQGWTLQLDRHDQRRKMDHTRRFRISCLLQPILVRSKSNEIQELIDESRVTHSDCESINCWSSKELQLSATHEGEWVQRGCDTRGLWIYFKNHLDL